MKKIISALLLLVTILSITSCGKEELEMKEMVMTLDHYVYINKIEINKSNTESSGTVYFEYKNLTDEPRSYHDSDIVIKALSNGKIVGVVKENNENANIQVDKRESIDIQFDFDGANNYLDFEIVVEDNAKELKDFTTYYQIDLANLTYTIQEEEP